jgi:hypothetical protein
MTQSIPDIKLKRFIELSLGTNQIRNATNVLYIFVSNVVDEIGYKLGFIARRKETNEKLSEYMELINKIFQLNFEISIFTSSQITTIKVVEVLCKLKKREEVFPELYLKELTQLYFNLRNMQVPNLQDHLKDSDIMENRTVSLMSFLGKRNYSNSNSNNPIKPLLLHRIRQDQKQLAAQLQIKLDQEAMLRLIQLKSLEKSLQADSKVKKIYVSGNLQDNIDYSLLTSNRGRYGVLGIIITFLLLGIVSIAEMLVLGFVTAEIGELLLLCSLMVLIFAFINKKWYYKRS